MYYKIVFILVVFKYDIYKDIFWNNVCIIYIIISSAQSLESFKALQKLFMLFCGMNSLNTAEYKFYLKSGVVKFQFIIIITTL